jgi:hypothetical protein
MERTAWSDERINDAFELLRRDIGELRADIRGLRTDMGADVGGLRADMGEEFRSVRSELASLNRQMFLGAVGIIAALLGVLATIVATA